MDELEGQLVGWGFQCDILKAEEGHERGERVRVVEGLASIETPDQQNEILIHKGINFDMLLKTGYINYDHLDVRGSGSPDALIGIPTEARIIKSDGHDAFYIKGYLFADPVNKPLADAAWRHLQALAAQKSFGQGQDRRMGWSIQGRTLMKVGGRIMKSHITDVAMTHKPVHLGTNVSFTEVLKSLTAAHGDLLLRSGADIGSLTPLLGEDLRNADGTKARSKGRKRSVDGLMKAIYGEPGVCKCDHIDRQTGMFKSEHGATAHLHECLGYDHEQARGFVSVMKSAWR